MKKIIKSVEPNELREYRETTPNASYDAMPSKKELRKSLLAEQGYICAFCMRRIPYKDSSEKETSKIAHLKSRSKYPEKEMCLNYENMVICCSGAINIDYHCDKKQGNEDILFSLFREPLFTTLKYSSKDGTISSTNIQYNTEIKDVLNLNNALLKSNRKAVITEVITALDATKWSKNRMTELLSFWNNKDNEGKYKPYCGIVTWYLQKKLNQAVK